MTSALLKHFTNSDLTSLLNNSIFPSLNLPQRTKFWVLLVYKHKKHFSKISMTFLISTPRALTTSPFQQSEEKEIQILCFPIGLNLAGAICMHADMWGDTHDSSRLANQAKCIFVSTIINFKSWKDVYGTESEGNGTLSHVSAPTAIVQDQLALLVVPSSGSFLFWAGSICCTFFISFSF